MIMIYLILQICRKESKNYVNKTNNIYECFYTHVQSFNFNLKLQGFSCVIVCSAHYKCYVEKIIVVTKEHA